MCDYFLEYYNVLMRCKKVVGFAHPTSFIYLKMCHTKQGFNRLSKKRPRKGTTTFLKIFSPYLITRFLRFNKAKVTIEF